MTTSSGQGKSSGNKTLVALLLLGAGLVGVIIIAALAWFFVLRDTSAVDVNTEEAVAARQDAIDDAGTGASDGIEGTWMVDTSFGSFDEACLSDVCDSTFAGFRIDEVLANFGEKTVIGRTPAVTGAIEISGSTIVAADIRVDMTGILTDSGGRTSAIRNQAIETSAFPEASFVLTSPVDMGSVPENLETVTVSAVGDFTIHGVTRSETIELAAQLNGNVVVLFGQLGPVPLSDYDIDLPSAPVVVSVEDNALIEIQLFLTKG